MGCDSQFDVPKKFLVEDKGPRIQTTVFPPDAFSSTLRPVPRFQVNEDGPAQKAQGFGFPGQTGPVEEKQLEPLQGERPPLTEFEQKLKSLINRYSMENQSGTPDFILAEYLSHCLKAFTLATRAREHWYGRRVF